MPIISLIAQWREMVSERKRTEKSKQAKKFQRKRVEEEEEEKNLIKEEISFDS